MYKYFKQVNCSHLVYAINNKIYEPIVDIDDSGMISGILDKLEDLESTTSLDPIAEYFTSIGEKVEKEFIKFWNDPEYKEQESYKIDGITIRPDLIKIDRDKKYIHAIEVKSTTSSDWYKKNGDISLKKLKHLFDAEFQYHLLKKKFPDYNIDFSVGVINKIGWPEPKFKVILLTPYFCAADEFEVWCKSINDILFSGANSYNMDASKSRCIYNLECGKCGYNPKKIYDNFDVAKIKSVLSEYPNKLAMIDFETINDPLPSASHYAPYDKVVVQLSCHLMEEGKVVEHDEYLANSTSLEELEKIYNKLVSYKDRGYKMVAYYKSFEKGCFNIMGELLGRDELSDYELLDLMDFFKKGKELAPISQVDFGQSASIKKTIQFAYGSEDNNPYKNGELNINNGGKAMAQLYKKVIEQQEVNDKELLAYCKQDTLTMVDIYNKIIEELSNYDG